MEDADKKTDFKAKFAAIKANNERLNACPRHLFPIDVPGIDQGVAAMFGRKMKCRNCNAEADLLYINAYIRGYEAHGGNGNDILPGWKADDGPKRKFFKLKPDTGGD